MRAATQLVGTSGLLRRSTYSAKVLGGNVGPRLLKKRWRDMAGEWRRGGLVGREKDIGALSCRETRVASGGVVMKRRRWL